MTRPKTAAQVASPREQGRFTSRMMASLNSVSHKLTEHDPGTPIYNAVLADLTKPKRGKR